MAYSVPDESELRDVVLVDLDTTGVTTAQPFAGYEVATRTGKVFQLVKFDSSGVAAIAGAPAVWQKTSTAYVVTADVSDGGSYAFAGVFCAVIADTKYGYIQKKGECTAKVSSGVSAGDPLYVANDGYFDTATEGTHHIVAYAKTDASSGEATVVLI